MRILFTTENYFPNVSGVPVVVKYLAEGLSNLGNDVAIATSCYKDTPMYEVINGVAVYRFDLHKSSFNGYYGKDKNKYVDFVLNFNSDIIVLECVTCVTTDLLLPYLNKICAKKILHSHGLSGLLLKPFNWCGSFIHTLANTYHWLYYNFYFRFRFPKSIKYFDKIICLSEVDNSIDYFNRYGIRCEILGNAMEDSFLEKTKPIILPFFDSTETPYFISVANYTQIKNQINILREFYKTKLRQYTMVFVGLAKNSYYDKLLQEREVLEKKYGHMNVLFLTGISRDYIPDMIGNAKLYLVGSTFEMYSISIIEAMAKGVPFISTNVGNARLLPGGITIDNINKLSPTITELLQKESEYNKYRVNGRKFVSDNCVREKVVQRLQTILFTL